ncbi:MAG TPA: thiamine pyrophosphate-dependent enzyme, partial [Methylomirabilota bacterium]|nr:thiamine pyrophosphate-dependent enzyme [Methylomirabilota bacterium]
ITPRLLRLLKVRSHVLPSRLPEVESLMAEACRAMTAHALPVALIVQQGTVAPGEIDEPPRPRPPATHVDDLRTRGRPSPRLEVLARLLACVPDRAAIITTTGKSGRELYTLADRPQHLYQVGSMGCASAMGLGVALHVNRPVIVIDGDGAALMKLGALATIGAYAPPNLVHVILDNGVHDSTGGQRTVSTSVSFAGVASACSYRRAASCDDLPGFERALRDSLAAPGPHLIHVAIAPGSIPDLARPKTPPAEVARRFRAFLAAAA